MDLIRAFSMADKLTSRDRGDASLKTAHSSAQAGDSAELIAHIQTAAEKQKALLARELHDELGGLLVGAVMDVAWAEQHLAVPPAELKLKLTRARQTLSAAIDLKRRLIEDLRPTLVDNVGLFAALRWHVQASCSSAERGCTITLPDDERRFQPNVAITLFRIVQEALAVVASRAPNSSTDFTVSTDPETLTLTLRNRVVAGATAVEHRVDQHALATVKYRINALGGTFAAAGLSELIDGDASITARFPGDAVFAAA